MKELLIAALGTVVFLSIVGCETTRGAGKDLENAGENVQEAVEDAVD